MSENASKMRKRFCKASMSQSKPQAQRALVFAVLNLKDNILTRYNVLFDKSLAQSDNNCLFNVHKDERATKIPLIIRHKTARFPKT